MKTITSNASRVLRYIKLHQVFRGRAPTLKQIADFFGVTRQSIHEQTRRLRNKGLLGEQVTVYTFPDTKQVSLSPD